MPHWSSFVFHSAYDALREIDRVLNLSMIGIGQISKSVPLAEALQEIDRSWGELDEEGAARDLERAKELANFAEEEGTRGFPVLHAHAVVALWGLLEVFIEDLVVASLEHEPELLKSERLASIKVALADFEELDRVERLRYVVNEFVRSTKADLKQRVTRFEGLLDLVGLSGPVPERVRRDLFELNQVRNLVAHRAGRADRRIVRACPWMELEVGGKLLVTVEHYRKYAEAIGSYLVELVHRTVARKGETTSAGNDDNASPSEAEGDGAA